MFLLSNPVYPQIDISIMGSYNPTRIVAMPQAGSYIMTDLGNKSIRFSSDSIKAFMFVLNNRKLCIYKRWTLLFTCDSVELKGTGVSNEIMIGVIQKPDTIAHIYPDDFIIHAQPKEILIINRVNIEKYTCGAVESEGGLHSATSEYFKVQAIICRTYALKNLNKHSREGYNLCDDTHCQVYHGKCQDRFNSIMPAVNQTHGYVIANQKKELISTTFYSNSGGETANSEDVWFINLPNLRSVPDSFSMNSFHTYWEKQIQRSSWLDYLSRNFNYPVNDQAMLDSALNFKQTQRQAYFPGKIPLTRIRSDLGLNSTFFSVINKGDTLLLQGRGYGHGVGLSQEGAMNMAKKNYSYQDIIKHYYTNSQIINIKELKK